MTRDCKRVLVAMQPSFLPWLGYFALIAEADIFVFLDDVQLTRRSWQCRNRVSSPNGEVMVSLPIAGRPSRPLIKDAGIADQPVAETLMSRIEGCLGLAPHWPAVRDILCAGFRRVPLGVAEFNIGLIRDIADALELEAEFWRSSIIDIGMTNRATRLPKICQVFDADCYLSPVGSIGYLRNDRPFDVASISLGFQNFSHPLYRQGGPQFLSHMSVIDAIAWIGTDATRDAILSGIGPWFSEAELTGEEEEGLNE